MEPDDKPVLHPSPRKLWRDALAVASIWVVGFWTAVFVAFWFMLH
jgi:hypothetical protein